MSLHVYTARRCRFCHADVSPPCDTEAEMQVCIRLLPARRHVKYATEALRAWPWLTNDEAGRVADVLVAAHGWRDR